MAFDTIGIGAAANDGTGDPLRTAFGKINANFGLFGVVTTTVQAALDALPATGGSIFIPPGVYQEAVRVTKPNVTITGTWDSVIKTPDSATGLVNDCPLRVLADDCTIEGISIDGNRSGNAALDDFTLGRSADGIGIYADRCTVRGCSISNTIGHGIIVWNDPFAAGSIAVGARFDSLIIDNFVDGTGAQRSAIDIASTASVGAGYDTNINARHVIRGNVVTGNAITIHTGWDILIDGNTVHDGSIGAHTNSQRVNIVNNVLDGSQIIVRGDVSTTFDCRVDGNTVTPGASDTSGIRLYNVERCAVSRNIVRGGTAEGIDFYHLTDCTFDGNFLSGQAARGFVHRVTGPVTRVRFINNDTRAVGTYHYDFGAATATDVTIQGNRISGGQRGVYVSNATNCTFFRVRDNEIISTSSHGMQVYAATSEVIGNFIRGVGADAIDIGGTEITVMGNRVRSAAWRAVHCQTAATNAIIVDNVLTCTDATPINNVQSGSVVRDNVLNSVFTTGV